MAWMIPSRMAAWIRASSGDGMDGTTHHWEGGMKEWTGDGMDDTLIGWQHG